MTKTYEALATSAFSANCQYIHSAELPEIVHFEDPASDVFTDFSKTKAFSINKESPIDEAYDEMRFCGVHLLLVTDFDDSVVGLISSEDILGAKPLELIRDRKIARSDIRVKGIMVPYNSILAVPYTELKLAKVGHVIATLKQHQQHYALIVEQEKVCGLFSLSQISRQLNINVTDGDLLAHSLAELQLKVNK